MADFPTSKVQKALAERGLTSSAIPAWREGLRRAATVPASRAIQAPDVITGLRGSWAAEFSLGQSVSDLSVPQSPAQVETRTSRLGQPGMAEINFRPYDWNTTRGNKYGPSLLGHPISFQIVGPTLKNFELDHQWIFTAGATQDVLNIDQNAGVRSTVGVPAPPSFLTILDIYGINAMPDEGLYLVVSMTGSPGTITAAGGGDTDGGLGDGMIGDHAVGTPRNPVSPLFDYSKYEIFRVVTVGGQSLTLDSGKRISDFFTTPGGTQIIRAITLIKPAAARVVAVPSTSGSASANQGTTFAIVPPKKSLNADLMPNYGRWLTTGFFDPWTNFLNGASGNLGLADDFKQANNLPIPLHINRGSGHVQGITGEGLIPSTMGQMNLALKAGVAFDAASDVGRIIHIKNVHQLRFAELFGLSAVGATNELGDPSLDILLGYWEIVATGINFGPDNLDLYTVRMITQFNPDTAVPFYGNGNMLRQNAQVGGARIDLEWTLHDPIENLWTSAHLMRPALESATLGNLINPSWVQHSVKGATAAGVGGHWARADRAAFDTASTNFGAVGTNANPGSLMDLGFRVVIYPAKEANGNANLVADFDNPLNANEIVLDPTKTDENQWIEVDYSSGLIHLSHPVVPGVDCQLVPEPNTLINLENPRGEVVFFVSCVPFSREPGQTGANPHITVGDAFGAEDDWCAGQNHQPSDLYGSRKHWPVTIGQTITSGPGNTIELAVALTPLDLPPSGFVEIVVGNDVPLGIFSQTDGAGSRVATFGYTDVLYVDAGNGNNTTLRNTFGGGIESPADTLLPTAVTQLTAVLRRNVIMPNDSFGKAGTSFQGDTTYGHAKRSKVMRFRHGTMTPESDGSVTLDLKDPKTASHERLFKDLFSSWLLSGGVEQTGGYGGGFGGTLHFDETAVLIEGIRTVIPESFRGITLVTGTGYFFVNGANPSCPGFGQSATLPLPSSNDVLIGQWTDDGVDITAWIDLRNPLADIDKRLDITVGAHLGHAQPGDAHFLELADAVNYISTLTRDTATGQWRKIRVVGPTTEDITKLPITPNINGLIIEGSMWRSDGPTQATHHEILWQGAAPALFSLEGCSNVTFRNLTFRYDADGAGASAVVPDRTLFTVGAGGADQILFDQVILQGPAHGFFHAEDPLNENFVLERLTFRDCIAEGVTDFAIRAESDIFAMYDIQILHCKFHAATAADVTRQCGFTDAGIIHFLAATGTRMMVRDSWLSGGDHGLRLGGSGPHWVEDCYIYNTDQSAVYCSTANTRVTGCDIRSVHTIAASFHTDKVAIFGTSAATASYIESNEITISGAVGTDHSIFLHPSSSDGTIIANDCSTSIEVGSKTTVASNIVGSGITVAGAECAIRGNRVVGDLILTAAGDNSTVSDNIVDGVLNNVSASECTFSGNQYLADSGHISFSGNTFNGDSWGNQANINSGRLTISDGNVFNGCFFYDGFEEDTSADDNVFSACNIRTDSNMSFVGDNNLFSGCKIWTVAIGTIHTFDGIRNQFIGNQTSAVTFRLHDVGADAKTHLMVVGNYTEERQEVALNEDGGWVVEGNYCVVSDNLVEGYEVYSTNDLDSITVVGTNNVVNGNMLEKRLKVNGDTNVVSGNNALGGFINLGTDDNCAYLSNYFGRTGDTVPRLDLQGTNHLVDGNWVGGDLDAVSTNTLVTNNRVTGDAIFNGVDSVFRDNYITIDATMSGLRSMYAGNTVVNDVVVGSAATDANFIGNHFCRNGTGTFTTDADDTEYRDNTFGGAAQFGGGVSYKQNLIGNLFGGTFTLLAAESIGDSTISGNHFIGAVTMSNGGTVSLTNCTVNGNHSVTTFTCEYAVRSTFSGNRLNALADLDNSDQCVVNGNWIGTSAGGVASLSLLAADNYVVMGNFITGDILVDGAAVGEADTGIVVGNRAREIAPAAAAVPTNGFVAVGNKVDNALTIMFTSPTTATKINDNCTD